MINETGLRPCGRAVLVKPYQPEQARGLIELPDFVKTGQQVVEQRAIVVDIGPECWEGEKSPRASIGDKVLLSAYAGYMAIGPSDGQQYRFVNDKDIFAIITHQETGNV